MKRLQNRISGSRFALPVTAVYSLAAWLGMCAICGRTYAELAVFAMSAYLMAELNNLNALIRMYSRMVSCSFLVLGTMAAPAIGRLEVFVVQLCFIAAYLLLFASYQDKRAQGRMFYAFMFIGAASAVCPPSLLFVPVLWVLAATNLMAMSLAQFLGFGHRTDHTILVHRRILRHYGRHDNPTPPGRQASRRRWIRHDTCRSPALLCHSQ